MLSNIGSKVHLCFFGSDHEDQLRKCCLERARSTGFFDEIHSYDPAKLRERMPQVGQLGFVMSEGHQYAQWKPWVVLDVLESCCLPGDVVVFMNLRGTLVSQGRSTFKSYLDRLLSSGKGFLAFENPFRLNRSLTKMDVLMMYPSYKDWFLPQVTSNFFLVEKDREGRAETILRYWRLLLEDPHLHADNQSTMKNHPNFIGHQGDQSLLDLVCRTNDAEIMSANFEPPLRLQQSSAQLLGKQVNQGRWEDQEEEEPVVPFLNTTGS